MSHENLYCYTCNTVINNHVLVKQVLFPNEGLSTSYHASDTVCKSCVTLKIYWIGCSRLSLTLVIIVVIPSTNLAIT